MLTTVTQLEALKGIYHDLRESTDKNAQILAKLLKQEIARRENAGRKPTSKLTRREQNRLAQQRFRAKRKQLDK